MSPSKTWLPVTLTTKVIESVLASWEKNLWAALKNVRKSRSLPTCWDRTMNRKFSGHLRVCSGRKPSKSSSKESRHPSKSTKELAKTWFQAITESAWRAHLSSTNFQWIEVGYTMRWSPASKAILIDVRQPRKSKKSKSMRVNRPPLLVSVWNYIISARIFTSLPGIRTIRPRKSLSQVTVVMHSCTKQTTYSVLWFRIARSWMASITGKSLLMQGLNTSWRSAWPPSKNSQSATPFVITISVSASMALASYAMVAMRRVSSMASPSRKKES